jgi:hypothetical protein
LRHAVELRKLAVSLQPTETSGCRVARHAVNGAAHPLLPHSGEVKASCSPGRLPVDVADVVFARVLDIVRYAEDSVSRAAADQIQALNKVEAVELI